MFEHFKEKIQNLSLKKKIMSEEIWQLPHFHTPSLPHQQCTLIPTINEV